MNKEQENLLQQVEPMLINCWNFNNFEKCVDVNISLAYYPKEYDGTNPPKIRFDLIMVSGRKQNNLNCSKIYIDMVNCMTKCIYESICSYKSHK